MRRLLALALFVLAMGSAPLQAQGWAEYRADDFGYAMLVPEGTQMIEKTWSGGWGGYRGESDGVIVVGVAKLGAPEAAAEIERFGVEVTGVAADHWSEVDSGKGNGWIWFKTVRAEHGGALWYGGYGVGPRGSYLIMLKTTPADFASHRSDFETWYASIRLF